MHSGSCELRYELPTYGTHRGCRLAALIGGRGGG